MTNTGPFIVVEEEEEASGCGARCGSMMLCGKGLRIGVAYQRSNLGDGVVSLAPLIRRAQQMGYLEVHVRVPFLTVMNSHGKPSYRYADNVCQFLGQAQSSAVTHCHSSKMLDAVFTTGEVTSEHNKAAIVRHVTIRALLKKKHNVANISEAVVVCGPGGVLPAKCTVSFRKRHELTEIIVGSEKYTADSIPTDETFLQSLSEHTRTKMTTAVDGAAVAPVVAWEFSLESFLYSACPQPPREYSTGAVKPEAPSISISSIADNSCVFEINQLDLEDSIH